MLYAATDTMYPGQIQCLWDVLHQITLAIYPALSFPHHTWSRASASWSQYSCRLFCSLPSPVFLRFSNQALRLNLKLGSTFCGLNNLQWHVCMCIHICVSASVRVCVPMHVHAHTCTLCANSSLIKEIPFAGLFSVAELIMDGCQYILTLHTPEDPTVWPPARVWQSRVITPMGTGFTAVTQTLNHPRGMIIHCHALIVN